MNPRKITELRKSIGELGHKMGWCEDQGDAHEHVYQLLRILEAVLLELEPEPTRTDAKFNRITGNSSLHQ